MELGKWEGKTDIFATSQSVDRRASSRENREPMGGVAGARALELELVEAFE